MNNKRGLLLICALILALSSILVGCSSSDKFAGTWFVKEYWPQMTGTTGGITIVEIKKNGNGNGYLVTISSMQHDKHVDGLFWKDYYKDGDVVGWRFASLGTFPAIGNPNNNTFTFEANNNKIIWAFNETEKTLESMQKDPDGKLLEKFANELQSERQEYLKEKLPDKQITVEGYKELMEKLKQIAQAKK